VDGAGEGKVSKEVALWVVDFDSTRLARGLGGRDVMVPRGWVANVHYLQWPRRGELKLRSLSAKVAVVSTTATQERRR
jgi:hypothetical protein